MGLMFSVNDYTREMESWEQEIIDRFFASMSWETVGEIEKDAEGNDVKVKDADGNDTDELKMAKKNTVEVAEVPYGDLMMMVDMDNRYTYKGSVTTPPCAQNVYWNVLRTVYPIK